MNSTFEQKSMCLLADQQAGEIYRKQPRRTGLFPTWIPGTRAALFQGEHQQVSRPMASLHTNSMLQGGNWLVDATNPGMKQLTTPLTGATMAKYSKNYRTSDASRFPSTPTTYYLQTTPCNFRQPSGGWTMLCLQSSVGGHNPYDVNMYL
jgi:hypothetical protein